MSRERRKEERATLENRPLYCKIILEKERSLWSIVHDINNDGVKLKFEDELPAYLKTGDKITLKFTYIEKLIKDKMEVKSEIRWIQKKFMGVKFLEKLNIPFNIELKESFKALDVKEEQHE